MTELSFLNICLRLGLAMLVGMTIGGQRSRMYHAAGLRTHVLVCVGACTIMMTGIMVFHNANIYYGANPDPARLPAQIINGIGFLGTGTILKDSFSIRGLTSAASLWVTACIGIAAGLGFYKLTLIALFAVLMTLVLFHLLWENTSMGKSTRMRVLLECENMADVLPEIHTLSMQYHAKLESISFDRTKRNTHRLTFQLLFPVQDWHKVQSVFLQSLAIMPGLLEMEEMQG